MQTRRINRAGVSVIMVEQNAKRCLQICDRGYVLDQGRNAYTAQRAGPDQRPEGHRAVPRDAGQEGLSPARDRAPHPHSDEGARPVVGPLRCAAVDQMTPVTYFEVLVLVVGAVLEDADGGLGRATGVAQVARTGDTLVVDVLALVRAGRRTP